ncbi:MAG: AI-2E family transporter, partial [Alphaproteobacteria bacterium]|nr:AI-2E family transporter [Alphaproteobacteria bacterium]
MTAVSRRDQGPARRRTSFSSIPKASADTFIIGAIIIAALYFGKDLLVPLAVAVLLSFILAPLVRLLCQAFIPTAISVIVVVGLAFFVLVAASYLAAQQAPDLAANLPLYEASLRKKIQSLRGATVDGSTLERATETLSDLSKELADSKKGDRSDPAALVPEVVRPSGTIENPLIVEIKEGADSVLQTYRIIVETLVPPIAMTGLVFLYATFILLQRQDLRDRFIRLAGGDLERTTAAMADAGQRLSRFFLVQVMVNSVYGVAIGLGLYALGVPNPALWGGLAFLMRYVPYVGSFVAAAFPLILAAAVDPSWQLFYLTLALYLIGELMMGQVVEPLAFGHSIGLSPFAFIVAATFWTALWGPVGLVLAAPLTSILVVIGRHVDRLMFLDVLLGDQPALSADEMLYQRLLAGDPYEAAEQAETYLKSHSLLTYYDNVTLGALRLAQRDAERGALSGEKVSEISASVTEIIDDLSYFEDRTPQQTSAKAAIGELTDGSAGPFADNREQADSDTDLPDLPMLQTDGL